MPRTSRAVHPAPAAWRRAGTATSVAQSCEARWRVCAYVRAGPRLFIGVRASERQKWSDGAETAQADSPPSDAHAHISASAHQSTCARGGKANFDSQRPRVGGSAFWPRGAR